MKALLAVLPIVAVVLPGHGQKTVGPLPPTPAVGLARIAREESPDIDGVLDETVWQAASRIDDLRQVVPVEGASPSEHTEVLLMYHERSLLIGLRCLDRDPAGIRATKMMRDANLDPDDRVEILIDPFFDRRNAFWFQIGPAGSQGDALITRNGGQFNKEWDGIWYGRARVTDEGWTAEIELPFNTINFDPKGSTWGFNVRRFIKRRNEEARWATPVQRVRFFSVANAGQIDGLAGMQQGIGLDLVPFIVADHRSDAVTDEVDQEVDAGLDAFYNVTPNAKLSLSINTDFAETEVDERRVNLTRFPLFFPEKRAFFLEDAGNFSFGLSGRSNRDAIPFFSRRIGLDQNGEEVPIRAAVKFTGQTDGYSFGLLDVQTEETDTVDAKNLFVGRFSKNVLEQSDVGVIFTHGNPAQPEQNYLYGLDFNYRTNGFLGDRNLDLNATYLQSETEGLRGDDRSASLRLAYPNDEIDLEASWVLVEENFNPALGFAPRRGINKYEGDFAYRPRLYTDVRRLLFSIEPTWITDVSNELETFRLEIMPFGIELETGDEAGLVVIYNGEELDQDFDITPDVTIPLGSYTWARGGVRFETADQRAFVVEGSLTAGGFFDGDRTDAELELDWRPSRYANFGLELERNDVRLPAGDFFVQLARLRANFLFTPDISWSNFVQFDNVSETVGLNSRFWYIIQQGREMFFVVNQGWDVQDEGFATLSTDFAFKVGYTLRF